MIITACLIFMRFSSQSFAQYCELERQTLDVLNAQLNALDTQLSWSKKNRNATGVNGIGTLAIAYVSLRLDNGPISRPILAAILAATAINGFNFYVAAKDVLFYKEAIEVVKKEIADKTHEIDQGLCLSSEIRKTSNQDVQELYIGLMAINKTLFKDIADLEKQLGDWNYGTKLGAQVHVGAAILLVAGLGLMSTGAAVPSAIGYIAAFGSAEVNFLSQFVHMPAFIMSAKEARKLLSQIRVEHEKLKTQEQLLRAILTSSN